MELADEESTGGGVQRVSSAGRKSRLAAALRANLGRRKAQSRGRNAAEAGSGAPANSEAIGADAAIGAAATGSLDRSEATGSAEQRLLDEERDG